MLSTATTTRLLVLLHLSATVLAAVGAEDRASARTPAPPAKRAAEDPPDTPTRSPHGDIAGSDDDTDGARGTARGDVLLLLDRSEDTPSAAEKSPVKRDGTSAAGGMWFGPRMGRAASNEDQNVSPGMWFGPRMGRATSTEDSNFSPGMWFGPRMGRSSSIDEQNLSPGMWFGPRMGRSTSAGMWFGPRMGRSTSGEQVSEDDQLRRGADDVLLVFRRRQPGGADNRNELASGMWFGPRMGRRAEVGSATSPGMWFGPRKGRSSARDRPSADGAFVVSKKSSDASSQQGASPAGGMWFGPRMGRKREADWSGKRGRESPEGMWFGPRLG